MIIENKTEGTKVPYVVNGTRITFEDDLSLDLAKRQGDAPVVIDICRNSGGALVMGTTDAVDYVAQIYIPTAEYTEVPVVESEDPTMEGEGTAQRVIKKLNMSTVKLVLWGDSRG